ncbi:MAG TPA: acetamidase/formamidase family protein [Streptosporangiaceae bacterium]
MPHSPAAPAAHRAQAVPGHNRWHPDIPSVAEVISGGSVRLECQGRVEAGEDDDPAPDVVLCGPIAILGAEPGDILVIDILAVGRGGRHDVLAHPGIIGCAPAREAVAAPPAPEVDGALLGHLRPDLAEYRRIAAQAVRSAARGKEVARCAVAPLVTGARALLPVHAHGAKLSVGDLHFPPRRTAGGGGCQGPGAAGWIDLRVNLTKRGMERFRVSAPMLMSEPAGP